ncbi:MAG: M3 family metallopeptidase [Xanthobacteraceae bacterium]
MNEPAAAAPPEKPAERRNPLFGDWSSPFDAPPFDRIAPEHFPTVFAWTLKEHDAEIAAIVAQADEPSFANTIEALERSGQGLARIADTFYALVGAHSDEALLKIERDISPVLAAHRSRIYLNEALFRRVETLFAQRYRLELTREQAKVLQRYNIAFRRAGAHLPAPKKARLAEIAERLATLGTTFSQNVLADEQAYTLVLESEEDLAGLPDFVRMAAREAAEARGLAGKHVITLSRSSVEPFLQFSQRRDLREKIFSAWIARGEGGGATDNRAVIGEIVALRAEQARLLGHESFAHYRLDDTMAKTPEAVRELLDRVWPLARARAGADREALQALITEEGGNFRLAPWDWRYYAEKLRQRRCAVEEAQIKPYLQLEQMIAAAFDTAQRLFGLTFTPRADVPVWHPDVRVWEVRDAGGGHVGVFYGDYFARPSKRSGAWMTALRDQQKLLGEVRPLIVNVMNFSKAAEGEPALLSFDDARTLFHEFGHALHGLLSDVTYPLISGTGVLTDFVELPSQLYEHWLEQPDLLRRFALHWRTGEPMPPDLLERLLAARTFNQGFATVEYVASAVIDLDLHAQGSVENFDLAGFEQKTLKRIDMPEEIVPRHRPAHFSHVFSGGGYASAYYSYMWSEVLDADAFEAFAETGDVFDPKLAKRLRDHIYAAGGTQAPAEAYTAFRGRLPTSDALLRRRGLAEPPTEGGLA